MPFVRTLALLVLSVLSLGAPSSIVAQDAEPRRVGVVLLPRGAANADMTDSLTELLIAAIAARGASDIVGKEEFQAALGRDDAGTLACIESNACLGRMGRELRVGELIAGTLHLDQVADATGVVEHYRFELYRLDVESGSARGRVAREIDGGLSALLLALTASVDELYVEHVEPGAIVLETSPREARVVLDDVALVASEDGAFRRSFLSPGAHTLTARAQGHQGLAREITIEPGTTLMLSVELTPRVGEFSVSALTPTLGGLGAAMLGVGVGVGALSQGHPETALDMRQSQAYYDARTTEALVANVLMGTGGAVLIAAVVSFVLDLSRDEDEPVARAMRGEVATW